MSEDEVRYSCQLLELPPRGEAVAKVYTEHYELPRVGFPAELMHAHRIAVGQWFFWTPAERVTLADIDPNGVDPFPTEMTDEQRAELERLYEASKKLPKGPWPEFTGDGE